MPAPLKGFPNINFGRNGKDNESNGGKNWINTRLGGGKGGGILLLLSLVGTALKRGFSQENMFFFSWGPE